MRMGYDMRCFSAEVLALAVAGCLRIVRDKGFFKDEWRLERTGQRIRRHARREAQRALLARTVQGRRADAGAEEHECLDRLRRAARALEGARHARCSRATSSEQRLDRQRHPARGRHHRCSRSGSPARRGKPAIIVIGVLMVVTLFVFGYLVHAPTVEGRKLMLTRSKA